MKKNKILLILHGIQKRILRSKPLEIFCLIVLFFCFSINVSYSIERVKVNQIQENSNLEMQQKKVIIGKVSDPQGNPIPGATVVLKGTTTGVITDMDGNFSISGIPGNATLQFSFVGMKTQEVVIGAKTTINVTLAEKTIGLEEVVVVGYGSQSKHDVTGSIARIDMTKTADLPNTNVIQSLRGNVAGIMVTSDGRPGQSGSILIRGPRSLSASNDPLIVLDGIIFSGDLADISPNDVQSIDILKDVSASAIYGSRAANGVILVTSKKGTTEKPTIRFNSFYGVSDWAYKVKTFSPERYVQSKLDWRAQTGAVIDPTIAGNLFKSEADNYTAGISHDSYDEASQQSSIGSYDLSISGRSQYINYYISGAIVDEKGLVLNDNQKRTSFRANIDNQITDWLSFGFNSVFIHRNLSGESANLSNAYSASPYGNWYYSDGEPTQYVVFEDQTSVNSVRESILTTNEEIYDNLFSNIYAKISVPFIKGLDYRVNYSPNYRWGHNYNFFRQDKHLTNNTMNASKFDQKNFDWVLENILTYNKKFGEDHVFDATLLYGRNHYGFESTTSTASQLSSGANGFNNLGLGGVLTNSSDANSSEGVSSMARVNYRFKGRYLLTLTTRRDGSSVFAANNKYATFPSGSLAWVVSDEPFFINKVDFIDMLKLRLSYGSVGNQAIGPYQSLSLSGITQYVYGDGGPATLAVYPETMANPGLKWETTYTANAAIDFDLFKGRLGGTLEVYNSNTTDLLVRRTIPTMTGYASIFTNIGEINNKGIELTLNSINIKKDKFEWGTNFVFSTNRNRIVHLYNTDTNGDDIEDNDISNSWFIGYPITSYYDYVFDGIYQEGDNIPVGSQPGFVRFKDLNGDEKIDANDRTIIGSGGQPDNRFGITNTFSYGNFSLSVFANAMLGWISDFPLLNTAVSPNAPGKGKNQLDAGYWTSENKSTTRPSLVYNNPRNHNWYVSRNFVRIQDVSLSYKLSKEMLSKLKISSLTVFMSGKNLYTFTKWLGSDPESGGISADSFYPMPRTISFGVNVGF
jgi:TonB-linked SusC/RagA family outer membrane protein